MHEIKIYGEIVPFEDAWIMEMGGFSNLTSLQASLKEANGADVRVRINSCGGDVDTGFAMYAELRRYAKDNNAKVETFGEARVASIATVIFLAGDSRILTEHTEPFVHNAWVYAMGDSKQIMRVALELEKYNTKIAQHYANHTELTLDEALALMDAETSITTEEAKTMRFATAIEEVLRPAALQRFTNNQFNTDMNKNPKTLTILAKAEAFLKSVGLMAVNKIVTTSTEIEIDFYELADDDTVEVGAKARVDGKDAEGDYVMKSGETYVFKAGELTEIIPVENDVNEEAVALQAEIDTLTDQLAAVTNKAVELEASNKAQLAIINKYKGAGSEAAPSDPKPAPSRTTTVENKASVATSNFIKNNLLKQK